MRGDPKRPPLPISFALSGRLPELRKKKIKRESRNMIRRTKRRKRKNIPALSLENQLFRRHLFLVLRR